MNSLQNQTEYYERLLRSNSGYEYCGIYLDAGISGAKEVRPGFQTMIEKAKAGEINLIITKSISRFARNTIMLLQYVRELKDAGVGVIFEEQKINTLSSEGELLLTVLAAIAEEERKSVCSNVRWAIQNKFKRGEVMVDTNRLLGYDKDENGRLVVNKSQAKIIRLIYKQYLNGVSAYKIAKEFNNQGVPTYTNMPWSSCRILSIISNEKNMGDCLMQKCFVSDTGREEINKGQRTQYYVKNDHPAIIGRKRWEVAREIRESRKQKIYPFSSLLRCPYCNSTLVRFLQEGKRVDWICSNYLYRTKATCEGIRVPEETLLRITEGLMPITETMVVLEEEHGKKVAN